MTPEEKAAFINSQVACALIEMEAMKAENAACAIRCETPAYGAHAFRALIDKYTITHKHISRYLG